MICSSTYPVSLCAEASAERCACHMLARLIGPIASALYEFRDRHRWSKQSDRYCLTFCGPDYRHRPWSAPTATCLEGRR